MTLNSHVEPSLPVCNDCGDFVGEGETLCHHCAPHEHCRSCEAEVEIGAEMGLCDRCHWVYLDLREDRV